jgi:hypothetical protein
MCIHSNVTNRGDDGMGRRKGSVNKTNYKQSLAYRLSTEDRMRILANIIVDHILADMETKAKKKQASNV